MKIIGIVGSPRSNGNVDTLVEAVLAGAGEAGHETRKYDLNKMRFQGCQGCGYCKTHLGICKLDDELTPLLKDFNEAGAVVFGTPIYFRQPSGQFRLMQDRLYSFLKPDFSVTLAPGKKAVIVISQGNPDPVMCDAVTTGLDAVLKLYGFKQPAHIIMTLGGSPAAVNDRKELLDAAKAAGKAL